MKEGSDSVKEGIEEINNEIKPKEENKEETK
jgi:hypothetical protein